jgi:hypothetical protein
MLGDVMSGKVFPNNWQDVHDADADEFPQISYIDFMTGMSMWSIPSSHAVIMRVSNKKTGKVKELAYRKMGNARNCMLKLVEDPANEIVICDNESIHIIKSEDELNHD